MYYITWSFGPDAKFIGTNNSICIKIQDRMPSVSSDWTSFQEIQEKISEFSNTSMICGTDVHYCFKQVTLQPNLPIYNIGRVFLTFPKPCKGVWQRVTWNMCKTLWIRMHYAPLNYSIWKKPAPNNSAENLLAGPVHSTSFNSVLLFYLCTMASSSSAKFMDLN